MDKHLYIKVWNGEGVDSTPFPSVQNPARLDEFQFESARMGAAPEIRAELIWPTCLDDEWTDNVFVEFEGEKYFLYHRPSSEKNNDDERWHHSISFRSERSLLAGIYVYDAVEGDDSPASNNTTVRYSGQLDGFIQKLNASLNVSELSSRFVVVVDDGIETDDKTLTFEDKYFNEALSDAVETWGIPYYIFNSETSGKTEIHFGYYKTEIGDAQHPLTYRTEGLTMTKKEHSGNDVINRATGYGSSENLPWYYPNESDTGSHELGGVLNVAGQTKVDYNKLALRYADFAAEDEIFIWYNGYNYNKKGFSQILQNQVNHTSVDETFVYFSPLLSGGVSLDNAPLSVINKSVSDWEPSLESGFSGLQTKLIINNGYFFYLKAGRSIHFNPTESFSLQWNKYTEPTPVVTRKFVKYKKVGDSESDINSYLTSRAQHNIYWAYSLKDDTSQIDAVYVEDENAYVLTSESDGWYILEEKIEIAIGQWHAEIGDRISFSFASNLNRDLYYDVTNPYFVRGTSKGFFHDDNTYITGIKANPSDGDSLTISKTNWDAWMTPQPNLMPEIYRLSILDKVVNPSHPVRRFYNAKNYPFTPSAGYVPDVIAGEYIDENDGKVYNRYYFNEEGDPYLFGFPFNEKKPVEHISRYDEIKASITGIENSDHQPIDEFLDIAYDEHDNNRFIEDKDGGSETMEHLYFYVKLPKMPFNLFSCVGTEPAIISMTSGICAACKFQIMVEKDSNKNTVQVDEFGELKRDENGNIIFGTPQDEQQNTQIHEVWIALQKDISTYGSAQPRPFAGQQTEEGIKPEVGDKYVITGIWMPFEHILEAERRLSQQIVADVYNNNFHRFNSGIDFSRIYLEENPEKLSKLCDSAKIWVKHNDTDPAVGLYVSSFRYSMTTDALPEITVELADSLIPELSSIQLLESRVTKTVLNMSAPSGKPITSAAISSSEEEPVILETSKGRSSLDRTRLLNNLGLKPKGNSNRPIYLDEGNNPKEVDGIDVPENIHSAMNIEADGGVSAKDGIKVGNFQPGLLGSGARIDGMGNMEIESLYSRSFISTPEFRFNRISVTEGEWWNTNGYGTIQEVEVIDSTHGRITLRLEENDYASIKQGDLCRGIYNDLDGQYTTANLDDDSPLYNEGSDPGFGFSCKSGFFTSYFKVMQFEVNTQGSCIFTYELRNSSTPHPCAFMKFAQYGNTDINSGRCSSKYETSIGHYREMILDGVVTWKIQSANVTACFGWLEGLYIIQQDGSQRALHDYGLYAQNNVYFGSAFVQLNPQTIADLQDQLKNYTADFSDYTDVITVDDVGNIIGGLVNTSEGITTYRIRTAITVRKNGTVLVLAGAGEDASPGKYKISAIGRGCTCEVDSSEIRITAIDNLNDGQSGTTISDYDAMRAMERCEVDVTIDCEGLGVNLTKTFAVTIKHDSQPYVGADLTNEMSSVAWNTKTQGYVGLPISFGVKMWHNNEPLDIVQTSDVSVTSITGMTIYKDILTHPSGYKYCVLVITALPQNLPLKQEFTINCAASYAGVRYERTLIHTINKFTDTNVYSLIPSVSEVVYDKDSSTLSTNSIDCSVFCDSSDDKHYQVAYADFDTHNLGLFYKKFYTDGTSDATETEYTGSAIPINNTVKELVFYLYKKVGSTVDKTVKHDQEGVPVIANGETGAPGAPGADGNGISTQTAYYKKTSTPEPPSTEHLDENHGWYERGDSGWPIEGDSSEPYLWECVHVTYTQTSSQDFLKLVSVYNISVQPNLLRDTAFVSEDNMTAWDTYHLNGELVPGNINSWGCKPMDGGINDYNDMLQQVIWSPSGIKNITADKWYTLSFYSRTRKYVNLTSDRNEQGFGDETLYLRPGTYKLQANGRISSAASSAGVVLRASIFGPQIDGQDTWTNSQNLTISATNDTTGESDNLVIGTGGVYKIRFQAYKNESTENTEDVTVNWWRLKCTTDDSEFTTHIYPGVIDRSVYYKDRVKYTNAATNADLQWKTDDDTPDNDGWTFHSCTFKMASTWLSNVKSVLFRVQRVYLEIKCPKFEESIISTDWVPNENDVGNEYAIIPAGTWVPGEKYYYYGGVRNAVRVVDSTQWYILKKRTGKNGFVSTKSPDEDIDNWQPSSYMKYIATDAMFAQDVIADRMQVGRLSSIGSNGVEVNIGDGKLLFKGLNSVNIELGLDENGCAVLKFYDKEGNFQYDLGPNGITQNIAHEDNRFITYSQMNELEDEEYDPEQSVMYVHQIAVLPWYQFSEGFSQVNNVKTYNISGDSRPSLYDGMICDDTTQSPTTLQEWAAWFNNHMIPNGTYVGREVELRINNGRPGATYYSRKVYEVNGFSGKPTNVGALSYFIVNGSYTQLFCRLDGTPITMTSSNTIYDAIEYYSQQ